MPKRSTWGQDDSAHRKKEERVANQQEQPLEMRPGTGGGGAAQGDGRHGEDGPRDLGEGHLLDVLVIQPSSPSLSFPRRKTWMERRWFRKGKG